MATIKNAPQAPERHADPFPGSHNGSGVPHEPRLDWMYEQSAASVKPNDDELMNMPISAQKAGRTWKRIQPQYKQNIVEYIVYIYIYILIE